MVTDEINRIHFIANDSRKTRIFGRVSSFTLYSGISSSPSNMAQPAGFHHLLYIQVYHLHHQTWRSQMGGVQTWRSQTGGAQTRRNPVKEAFKRRAAC